MKARCFAPGVSQSLCRCALAALWRVWIVALCGCVATARAQSAAQASTAISATAVSAAPAPAPASASASASLLPPARFSGAPISMQFQSIELRAALQVLADFTQLNFVVSESVTGSLSVRLKDVPWDQALDAVLTAKGLGQRREGSVIWIAPLKEIAASEKHQMENRAALAAIEPLQTRAFTLHYARATEVLAQIQGLGAGLSGGAAGPGPFAAGWNAAPATPAPKLLSARGSALAEPRTNQLFVTDIAERLEQVQAVLARIDVPLRQVLIEARIVEASEQFGRALGVRIAGVDSAGTRSVMGNKLPAVVNNAALKGGATAVDATGQALNLPAAAVLGVEPATWALALFNADKTRLIALELSAMEAQGQGQVVSNPRVVTADQVKAVIEQGTELPYQVSASSGGTSIAFRKANLKLEVTPQIAPDGQIIMELDLHKDSVGQMTPAGFAIDTKHVSTQVRIEDGGTVMIGGIFETADNSNSAQVPGLGDVPGLGWLFGNRSRKRVKQELLVFLTPKMLVQRASAP